MIFFMIFLMISIMTFQMIFPLWFLHGSSNVPPIGGGRTNKRKFSENGVMHATDKKGPEGRLYVPVHGFRDLINKKRTGQKFIWLIFLVRRSETSPDVTVRL
jgi:hypothetical protein